MNNGWIKLHRSFLEWEWYDDHNTTRVFITCLLMANHKDKKYKGKVIKRGSFITGRELFASQVGLSVQKTRTSLNRLKLTNEITIKTSAQGTLIQVNNYHKYQQNNQQNNQQLTNDQPATNQQLTTNKNDKNIKNDKNKPLIVPLSEFLEYAKDKAKEYKMTVNDQTIKLKYEAWKEAGWKDGNGNVIKSWKSKVCHNLQHWQTTKGNQTEPTASKYDFL